MNIYLKRAILIVTLIFLPAISIVEEVARAWTNMRIRDTIRDDFRYWRRMWYQR